MPPRHVVIAIAILACTVAAGCGDNLVVPPDGAITACNDGLDNDGDRSIDFPADPGCDSADDLDESNPPIAMCSDGRDNDADGHIDYPNDPGCFSPLQDDEADDCPDGPACPACANGLDDDGDGLIDYPADPGCGAASEADEFEVNPNACGPNLIVTLLQTTLVTGTLPGAPSNLAAATCGGAGGEVPFQISLTQSAVLVATTDLPATAVDTVLYLRTVCTDPATELVCNDDLDATATASTITAILAPGTYYLVVDARDAGVGGAFALQVDLLRGEGQPCAMQSDCGPGLQCRVPVGQTEMVCAQPVCNDGADSDGDTLNDYPDDPGCDGPGDFDEADDCPDGPTCPACGNGLDDDFDTLIDYPADPDCAAASQPVEGCGVESDPVLTMTASPVMGTSVGMTDDFDLSCDGTGGLEVVYFIQVPDMSTLQLDTIGSNPTDTVLALYPPSCMAPELGCDDQSGGSSTSLLTFSNLAAGAYAIVVGNYSTGFGGPGPFTLNLSGTIAPGAACTSALAVSGAITCGTGYACTGGVCVGSLACNNGIDDDGDGDVDYPADAGCVSALDDDELDDCPAGPGCPQCGNGLDDDGDTLIDFPADPDCASASDDDESAPACVVESDPIPGFTSASVTGTTVGTTHDFSPSCGVGTSGDIVATVDLPAMAAFHVDATGSQYDAVMAVMDATCTTELGCDDALADGGEVIDLVDLAAGTYSVVMDGWAGLEGAYTLNIAGTIAPFGACDGALAVGGVIACGAGYACTGGICLGTAQCNNGVDDDADGKVDYPAEPGCATPADDDELDDCPAGPMCPQCSNGLDDDSDGLTDYPADPSCISAATNNEGVCGQETSPVAAIVIPLYAGTTIGGGDDFTPTCASLSPAQDRVYALTLPVPVQNLVVDTIGSTFDTVLSVTDATCAPIACDDQSGGGNTSRVTLTNVAAGAYGIIVDGWSGDGSYQLQVRGTVAPATACTAMLFTTGVLSCPANHICTTGTCQPL